MKSFARLSIIAVICAFCVAFCVQAEPIWAGLFFLPFTLWPLGVSYFVGSVSRWDFVVSVIIGTSSILYTSWLGWAYADIFYINPDPQSAIALLFLSVPASPFFLAAWLAALLLYNKRKVERNEN